MPAHTKLPPRITLLGWLVLITTAWNIVRLITACAWSEVLRAYLPYPGPAYIGITGAFWALVGSLLLWALRRRVAWALRAPLAAAIAYIAWTWADRLFLQAGLPQNWKFSLIGSIVLLAFTAAVTLDPRSQSYFGKEAHERELQESASS